MPPSGGRVELSAAIPKWRTIFASFSKLDGKKAKGNIIYKMNAMAGARDELGRSNNSESKYGQMCGLWVEALTHRKERHRGNDYLIWMWIAAFVQHFDSGFVCGASCQVLCASRRSARAAFHCWFFPSILKAFWFGCECWFSIWHFLCCPPSLILCPRCHLRRHATSFLRLICKLLWKIVY